MSVKSGKGNIAVIGLGCWYPGANEPRMLWENILARRREFRRFPLNRISLAEYYDPDPTAHDKTYANRAAFIDGFNFDFHKRRIPRSTFECTDITHWLALEVALQALEDCGNIPSPACRQRFGVIVGNTLTGEQARSQSMRLRWPFVRRALKAAAKANGFPSHEIDALALSMEQRFKSVFPPVTEDTLAGSLSNTIAGRICGFLDLHGGGYTVDGACSSSLLAVITAARAIADGELEMALAGGVDISLDSFELVGFAKTGALTQRDMSVYDRQGDGFIPGEGCAFAVLKELERAREDGDYVYAVISGWGVSSDGKGSITAPNQEGQVLALRRAYEQASYTGGMIDFIEGHGTGTVVGDRIELEAAALALAQLGDAPPRSCGITSFKSLVGHTKAAAGIGGFIKTVMALNQRVIPPTAGCQQPHPAFDGPAKILYPVLHGEIRDPNITLRAGVSSMGFGGINCHVALESGDPPSTKLKPGLDEHTLFMSPQSTELFIFSAPTPEALREKVAETRRRAEGISESELCDLANILAIENGNATADSVRGAVVAATVDQLLYRLERLTQVVSTPLRAETTIHIEKDSLYLGQRAKPRRIAFLFPGQGSQRVNMAHDLAERFDWARELMEQCDNWVQEAGGEPLNPLIFRPLDHALHAGQIREWERALSLTTIAQPAICLASVLWCELLKRLGVTPTAVAGHSLGELSAFWASGAFDTKTLLQIATLRGKAMQASGDRAGAIASLACSCEEAEHLTQSVDGYLVVANINSPRQTVVSGEVSAIETVLKTAANMGIAGTRLPVSNAFHSDLVASAAEMLRTSNFIPEHGWPRAIGDMPRLFSGVSGNAVDVEINLREHFTHQLISQVQFVSLARILAHHCDTIIEVGPGRTLCGLVEDTLGDKGPVCLPVESRAGSDDLNALLAHLFVTGHDIAWNVLYEARLTRPFTAANERRFIENPCERAFSDPDATSSAAPQPNTQMMQSSQSCTAVSNTITAKEAGNSPRLAREIPTDIQLTSDATGYIQELIFDAIVERTGFKRESLTDQLRLLDDLNLDSIKAAELIAQVSKHLDMVGRIDPLQLANAMICEIAGSFQQLLFPTDAEQDDDSLNVTTSRTDWNGVREFVMEPVQEPLTETQSINNDCHMLVVNECAQVETERMLLETLAKTNGIIASAIPAIPERLIQALEQDVNITHVVFLISGDRSTATRVNILVEQLALTSAVIDTERFTTLAYVTFGHEASVDAFAASVHLEQARLRVRAIRFEQTMPSDESVRCILNELSTPQAFEAARYDTAMRRYVMRRSLLEICSCTQRGIDWSGQDVVLVTGGAKGITAECALALAEKTGARMALIGTSPHGAEQIDPKVADTLARYEHKGLTAKYWQCDVAKKSDIDPLIRQIETELGPITAVLHGAGLNRPRRLETVTSEEALTELAPKLLGGMNLCQAFHGKQLKLFCALTSVIGITGMPGNAWYAFSNEMLERSISRFAADNPGISVLCLAYSVWAEIGMGARLGSDKALEFRGVDVIQPDDGVRRFLRLWDVEPGGLQVVVSGKLASGDTWRPSVILPGDTGDALRFLDSIVAWEPGVELIAETKLDLKEDLYLTDHIYNGMPLLPAVFGLEAMAQAVAAVTGRIQDFISGIPLQIRDVELLRPVVVNPYKGTKIQVRALCIERDNVEDPLRVRVSIRSIETGYAFDHFRALFVLTADLLPEVCKVEVPEQPLKLSPKVDLYGPILFQGKRFQRIERVFILEDPNDPVGQCLFKARHTDAPTNAAQSFRNRPTALFLIGDPYLRDAMLQSVQLIIPKDFCLPLRIETIDLWTTPSTAGDQLVWSRYEDRQDQEYLSSVTALSAQGEALERLRGYRVRIVKTRDENPTANDLAKPNRRDEILLQRELLHRSQRLGHKPPQIALCHSGALPSMSKEERHAFERTIVNRAVATLSPVSRGKRTKPATLKWTESGKPVLADTGGWGVSVSHDHDLCLCSVGDQPQGCDITPIENRDREDWLALIGSQGKELFDTLLQRGDSMSYAGCRVWTALEAATKAFETSVRLSLSEFHANNNTAIFKIRTQERNNAAVITFPLRLTLGGERMFAFVLCADMDLTHSSSINTPHPRYKKDLTKFWVEWDESKGCYISNYRFPLTMEDIVQRSRTVSFSRYSSWMGKIREIALAPVLEELDRATASGQWGMVTNSHETWILGEPLVKDRIVGRLWLRQVPQELRDSTCELWCEWNRELEDGAQETIALSTMRSTWVRILDHGTVAREAMPAFLRSFLKDVGAESAIGFKVERSVPQWKNLQLGRPVYDENASLVRGRVLSIEIFETDMEDSNLIGNLYFANYARWQNRTIDRYFNRIAPELFHDPALQKERLCLRSSTEHLREAMPMDRIQVTLSVQAVYEFGVRFSFEYHRLEQNGSTNKLAIGEHDAVWVRRDTMLTPDATTIPDQFRQVLLSEACLEF